MIEIPGQVNLLSFIVFKFVAERHQTPDFLDLNLVMYLFSGQSFLVTFTMIRSLSRGVSQTRLALRTMPGRSRSLQPPVSVRLMTTGPGQSGGAGVKVALTGLVGVTAVIGGTVGYAGYDPEFRWT